MTDASRKERRRKTRVQLDAPATVAVAKSEIAATTKDISERGLYCFTDANFEVGSDIDVVVTLPEEAGLPVSGMVCCHGRIVRSEASRGQYGLAVEIERLAPMPTANLE